MATDGRSNVLFLLLEPEKARDLQALATELKDSGLFEAHVTTRFQEAYSLIVDPSLPNYEVVVVQQSVNSLPPEAWRRVLNLTKEVNKFSEVIVVMTDDARGERSNEILNSGVYAYFVLPFQVGVLLGYINAANNRIQERMSRIALSESINQYETTEQIINKLCEQLKRFVRGYNRLTISLISERHLPLERGLSITGWSEINHIRTLLTVDPKESVNWQLLRPIEFHPLIKRVISKDTPFISPDIFNNPPPDWGSMGQDNDVASWIALPLFFGDRAIGLITLDSSERNHYTYENVNVVALQQIANQAAIAIKNAERHAAQQNLAKALRAVAESNNLEDTFLSIAEQACGLVGGLFSYVVRPDDVQSPKFLHFVAAWSQDKHGKFIDELRERFPSGFDVLGGTLNRGTKKKAITVLALERKEAVVVDDCRNRTGVPPLDQKAQEAYLPYLEETNSDLAVPIIEPVIEGDRVVRNQVVGVINIEHANPFAFTEEYLDTVQQFARFAALAIRNSDALDSARTKQRALSGLFELENDYITSTLGDAAGRMSRVADAAWVSIYAFKDGKTFRVGISDGATGLDQKLQSRGKDGHTIWSIKRNHPVLIGNIESYDINVLKEDTNQKFVGDDGVGYFVKNKEGIVVNPDTNRRRTKAVWCLPISYQQQIVGVVWLHFDSIKKYRRDEYDVVAAYAKQIADDLVGEQTRILYEIGHISSSGEEEAYALDRILNLIRDYLGVIGGAIYKTLPESQQLERKASNLAGFGLREKIKYGEGIAGQLVNKAKKSQRPSEEFEYFPDYDKYPHKVHSHGQVGILGAVIGIPIYDEVLGIIGVLIINDEKERTYDETLPFLQQIAKYIQTFFLVKYFHDRLHPVGTYNSKNLFMVTWYDPQVEPIFQAVEEAAQKSDLRAQREKDFQEGGENIPIRIQQGIQNAEFVVVLLTGLRPNVFWELGYADGLGKKVIRISKKGEEVPFDVNHLRRIEYETDENGKLKQEDLIEKLVKRIEEMK